MQIDILKLHPDAYDETMAAVVALEAHQAEHIALQQGYDAQGGK